ncbi:uncharacterized protein FFE2_01308 [Fusarium fujikuroi]|nr:uncharacterized protein FFE2_01308 [Fusarium fujikuroi]
MTLNDHHWYYHQ